MFKRMMGQLLKTNTQRVGNRLSVALLGLVAAPAFCVGLNDTGINYCSDDNLNGAACGTVAADNGSNPRQDGRFGRDAQFGVGKLKKVGGGGLGFDFTKISNGGGVLAANVAQGSGTGDWACTRDNVTGLIWEVKTATAGMHNQDETYSWYSSDSASNGGLPGTQNAGVCNSIAICDTQSFVAAVNSERLCNGTGWRLPTIKELEGLSDFGRGSTAPVATRGPAVDATYFPNTPSGSFWSGTASGANGVDAPNNAWSVDTTDGLTRISKKGMPIRVRLVRSGS